MIVVMEHSATAEQVDRVIEVMVEHGYDIHRSTGAEHIILGAIGRVGMLDPAAIELLSGVRQVVVISRSYRRVERSAFPQGRQVRLGRMTLGGAEVGLIPFLSGFPGKKWLEDFAAIEGNPMTMAVRQALDSDPSYVPEDGWDTWNLGKRLSFTLIAEIPDVSSWRVLSPVADAFLLRRTVWSEEIFLREAAKTGKPLLLHVSPGRPVEEVLTAADRIFRREFPDILLSIGFGGEGSAISSLNPDTIFSLKKNTFLPVLADFRGAGLLQDKLKVLCQAAIACGADGVLCDMHPDATGIRALDMASYGPLAERLRNIAAIVR